MSSTEAAERWALADRRDFLRRSLDDAEAEHEAGDLADDDYTALRRRDEAKLAEVESLLAAIDRRADEGADAPHADRGHRARPGRSARAGRSGRSGRRRRRAWLALVGGAALLAGVVVLLVNLTAGRLPGEGPTGGAQLSGQKALTQELDQAAVLADEGKDATALAVYAEVLSADPRQPTALAESGWLEWSSGSGSGDAGIEKRGRALEEKAVRAAPAFYAGHLYLGTIEFQEGDAPAAVAQYRLFLADHAPGAWAKDFAGEIRKAFAAAGQPVPSGVPAG